VGHRFSNQFIKTWEKRLVRILVIGIATAFVLGGGGVMAAQALGLEDLDSPISWTLAVVVGLGLAVGVLSVVGVIFVAAILGGLSLHPFGWIPGLFLAAWMFGGIALYPALGGGPGFLVHLLGFAPIVAVFYWMGLKARVPVYLRTPAPGSPRVHLCEGEGVSGTGQEKDPDRGDLSLKDDETP
jgi:hypothetical protein